VVGVVGWVGVVVIFNFSVLLVDGYYCVIYVVTYFCIIFV
jgi:hypothetical protein